MKGILFKLDMIKAIAECRKTVTRRIINPQPQWLDTAWYWKHPRYDNGDGVNYFHTVQISSSVLEAMIPCARYQVGDIVYIKEAWAADWAFDDSMPCDLSASNPIYFKDTKLPYPEYSTIGHWRSPLHLREAHARYFIEILDVRPERLQEIDELDVEKEGTPMEAPRPSGVDINDFRILWDSINAKRGYSWESNPWVWRIEFKLTNRKG